MNKKGKMLVEFLKKKGWVILNGKTIGDEEGEYTFTEGRGNSVINYVIKEERTRKKVERLYIGEKVNSDRHPVEIWIKRKGGKEKEKRRKKRLKARERYRQRRKIDSLKVK